MTIPRSSQISIVDTPWYHVVNRCVRRAFLCGVDSYTGTSYEHRRLWIEERIMQLASVFCIDVAAFAIMNNHYHLVLHVDKATAMSLSDDEVLLKWTEMFSSTILVSQYLELRKEGGIVPDYLKLSIAEIADVYRSRLFDISWFMRVLNESIARMANKEDDVKGRFWEGRFKSQAIMDESALMTVMAYVDLNPVRAAIAEDLASSDFTSVQCRLQGRYDKVQEVVVDKNPSNEEVKIDDDLKGNNKAMNQFLERLKGLPFSRLMPFYSAGSSLTVPFEYNDYIEFVDYMGRAVHPNKSGFICSDVPSVMEKFKLDDSIVGAFKDGKFLSKFGDAIGGQNGMKYVGASKGLRVAQMVFNGGVQFHHVVVA